MRNWRRFQASHAESPASAKAAKAAPAPPAAIPELKELIERPEFKRVLARYYHRRQRGSRYFDLY